MLKAKTEVFDFLKENGHIVLNGDDDKLAAIKRIQGTVPVFSVWKRGWMCMRTSLRAKASKGTSCRIHLGEESFSVFVPMPGRHMVYNALAAAAVGRIYGLTAEEIARGIESLKPISGRFRRIETDKF